MVFLTPDALFLDCKSKFKIESNPPSMKCLKHSLIDFHIIQQYRIDKTMCRMFQIMVSFNNQLLIICDPNP